MNPTANTDRDEVKFQSASLVALPSPDTPHPDHDTILDRVFNRQPYVSHTIETAFGKIGCICIPIVDRHLFADLDTTVQAALEGVVLAAQCGATTVSCTGMIPASTNGLVAVQKAMEISGFSREFPDMQLTTGHETVVAAFVLNVEQMCHTTGREFQQERVTCVGLGHIGNATLDLLLRLDYRPHSLYLVDVTSKESMLRDWQQKLVEAFDYQGHVEVITVSADRGLPESLYDKTTFILGATSSPYVIDIDRLRPGTMIVDDSFPLGFDTQKAMRRIQHQKDILITIAGALAGPYPVKSFASRFTGDTLTDAIFSQISRAANVDQFSLTGCVYSSVLSGHFDLPSALGKVRPDDALRHYTCYKEHGFHGTSIYIINLASESSGVYFVKADTLEYFRQHFSATPL